MNKLEHIKEVIYHELGHVIVYVLSNSNEETYLGKIKAITLGYKNRVMPEDNLYYYEPFKPTDHIFKNSLNIKRSLCWIILQFSGCLFEAYFEKNDFTSCYCSGGSCSGKTDYNNLQNFIHFSAIKFGDIEFVRLKTNFTAFLNSHDIFEKTIKYLTHFLGVFGSNDGLCLIGEDLEILTEEVRDMILNEQVIQSFHKLISEEENFYS